MIAAYLNYVALLVLLHKTSPIAVHETICLVDYISPGPYNRQYVAFHLIVSARCTNKRLAQAKLVVKLHSVNISSAACTTQWTPIPIVTL